MAALLSILLGLVISGAVMLLALAATLLVRIWPTSAYTGKEAFLGSFAFILGGGVGGILFAIPVVVLVVLPTAKLLKMMNELPLIYIGLAIYVLGVVITGILSFRGIMNDLRLKSGNT